MTMTPPPINQKKSTSCLRMPAKITPANTSSAILSKNLLARENNSNFAFLVSFLAIFIPFSFAKIGISIDTAKFFGLFLRFAEVLHDVSDGLGGEELGVARLVAGIQGFA